jgi:hypothetical protein
MSNNFNAVESLNSLVNDFNFWADKIGVLKEDRAEFVKTLGDKVGLVSTKIQNVIASFDEANYSPEAVSKSLSELTGSINSDNTYTDENGKVRRFYFS